MIVKHDPVPVVGRSKTYVCGRSNVGIAGSNPAQSSIYLVCCIDSGLCVDMITRPEESYRLRGFVILKPQNELALAVLRHRRKYDTEKTQVNPHGMT